MRFPILYTDRLTLRLPVAADLAPYTAYCQSERTRYVHGPFTPAQAFDKLAAMIGHWELRGFGRLVFTERATGRAIGHVGALQIDAAALPEITWTIWSGDDEGRGYAREACEVYLAHAAEKLGFHQMLARVAQDNAPSRGLAERMGGVLDADAVAPAHFPGSLTYAITLGASRPTGCRSAHS